MTKTDCLAGTVICISGALSVSKKEMVTTLQGAGATVASSFTAKVTHVLSTPADVAKATTKVKSAQTKGVPVIGESFIEASIKAGKKVSEKSHLLTSGAGPQKKIAKKSTVKGAAAKMKSVAVEAAAAPKPSPKKKGAVVAKPERGEWACMACTFFNAGSSSMCEVCFTPKGVGGMTRTASGRVEDEEPEVHLELVEGNSAKFWKLRISGCTTVITYGRIGTNGQTDSKIHANEQEARKFAEKIQKEKEKKGYSPA